MESINDVVQILEQIQSVIDKGSADRPSANKPSIVVQFFMKEVGTVNVFEGVCVEKGE